MQLGDVRVVVEHERAPTATPDGDLAVDRVRLAPARGRLDDAQPQSGAGLRPALPPLRRGLRHPRRLGRERGCAQLPQRQPHHSIEEEVQQGEEAELEDRQYGFGHEVGPLGRLETDGRGADPDLVAVLELPLADRDTVHRGAVHAAQVGDGETLARGADLGVAPGYLRIRK